MIIYIGSDHGGFRLKDAVENHLKAKGHEVVDLGPSVLDLDDDYPDFSYAVAKAVAVNEGALGILICRSGQGVCIVANKIPGVRAAVAWNEQAAASSRRDDHANVLCLPADYLQTWHALGIVDEWIATHPGRADRFKRRVNKIKAIEEKVGE